MWLRSLLLLVVALPAFAGAPKPTRISWHFDNVVDGFDHTHQMVITVDGETVATSEPGPETVPGMTSLTLPADAETLRIVSMALYEEEWEAHTVDNDYSVDCVWEFDVSGRPPKKIDVVCDIDEGPKAKVR